MNQIHLEKLTWDNVDDVLKLKNPGCAETVNFAFSFFCFSQPTEAQSSAGFPSAIS